VPTMIYSTSARWTITALTAVFLLGTGAAPAVGQEERGTTAAVTPFISVQGFRNCPLTRIGTQFVRCDNLTGAGVAAPRWVPES
jgi:hypothetical protein